MKTATSPLFGSLKNNLPSSGIYLPKGTEYLLYPYENFDTNKKSPTNKFGFMEPDGILKVLNSKFNNTEIILTLGEKGSLYSFKDELLKIKAHKLDTVDTTGAGDTFIGYYIAGIASKMNKKDNLNRASEAAAIATTKLGAAESIPRIN